MINVSPNHAIPDICDFGEVMGPSRGISRTETSWGGAGVAVCDGVGVGGSVLVTDGRGVQVLVLVGERTIVFVGVITFWAVPVQLARIKLAMIRSKTAILEFTVWTRFLDPPAGFASRTQPGR